MAKARIELELDATGAIVGTRQVGDAFTGLVRNMDTVNHSITDVEVGLSQKVPRAASRAERSLSDMGRRGQNVVTNISRVVQDLPFGIVAISNNIDQLGESFVRLSQEAGGPKGALKQIIAGFKGPGGILTLVSLATTAFILFGDKIVEALSRGTFSAKELRSAVDEVLTVVAKIPKLEINLADTEAAIKEIERNIARIVAEAPTVTIGTLGGAQALKQLTQEQQNQVNLNQQALESLKAQKKELEAQLLAAETLSKVSGVREKDEEKKKKKVKETTTAFEEAQKAVKDLRESLQSLEGAGLPALVALEKESLALERRLRRLQSLAEALARAEVAPQKVAGRPEEPGVRRAAGALSERTRAEETTAAMQAALRQLPETAADEMRRLEGEIAESLGRVSVLWAAFADENAMVIRDSFANLADTFSAIADIQSDSINEALDRQLSQIESSLDDRVAAYVRAGKSEVEAERQAREDIAEIQHQAQVRAAKERERAYRVYKAFAIAEAIADTFVAANKALATPPPFNFILMATTIAAGLANVARIIASHPGGGAPSGGGATGTGGGFAAQGESETAAGIQIPLPARREGGPVTAGMAHLVGEAGPEVFIPRRGGFILPNAALRSLGRSTAPAVAGAAAAAGPAAIRVDGHMQVAVEQIDLFRLSVKLDRLEARVTDLLGDG